MQLVYKQGSPTPYKGEPLPRLTELSAAGAMALLDIGANASESVRCGRLPASWLGKVAEAVVANDASAWKELMGQWLASDPVMNALEYFHGVSCLDIEEQA